MTFKEAMYESCKELGFDAHLKEIKYQKDAHTYAEKLAAAVCPRPFEVKNSFMFLNGVDFCFFQNGKDVDFSISGVISKDDKSDIKDAINTALRLCKLCEERLRRVRKYE